MSPNIGVHLVPACPASCWLCFVLYPAFLHAASIPKAVRMLLGVPELHPAACGCSEKLTSQTKTSLQQIAPSQRNKYKTTTTKIRTNTPKKRASHLTSLPLLCFQLLHKQIYFWQLGVPAPGLCNAIPAGLSSARLRSSGLGPCSGTAPAAARPDPGHF